MHKQEVLKGADELKEVWKKMLTSLKNELLSRVYKSNKDDLFNMIGSLSFGRKQVKVSLFAE